MDIGRKIVNYAILNSEVVKYKYKEKMFGTETYDYSIHYIYIRTRNEVEQTLNLKDIMDMTKDEFSPECCKVVNFTHKVARNKDSIYKLEIRTE